MKALEGGYFQREIAESAYRYARRRASGDQPVISVKSHGEPPEPAAIDIHRIDPATEARQVARLQAVRRRRDSPRVAALLDQLAEQARNPTRNLMPITIELVRARATVGEIVTRLKRVWGTYVERPVY